MIRRVTTVLTMLGCAAVLAVPAHATTSAASARMGAYGTVENRLPSRYTLKVARFVSDGASSCPIWNPSGGNDAPGNTVKATWRCNVRNLPSGTSSDNQFGWFYDADGLMIQDNYTFQNTSWAQSIPANVWSRFHDWTRMVCEVGANGPSCWAA